MRQLSSGLTLLLLFKEEEFIESKQIQRDVLFSRTAL